MTWREGRGVLSPPLNGYGLVLQRPCYESSTGGRFTNYRLVGGRISSVATAVGSSEGSRLGGQITNRSSGAGAVVVTDAVGDAATVVQVGSRCAGSTVGVAATHRFAGCSREADSLVSTAAG